MAGTSDRSSGSLSPQERSKLYREMADAAFLKAKYARNPQARTEYLTLAAGWHALAQEIEKEDRKRPRPGASLQKPNRSGNKGNGLG